jgi:hypothetical protein
MPDRNEALEQELLKRTGAPKQTFDVAARFQEVAKRARENQPKKPAPLTVDGTESATRPGRYASRVDINLPVEKK